MERWQIDNKKEANIQLVMGFPGGAVVKNLPANAGEAREVGSIPGSGRFPWRKKWLPTLGFLPGESHESPPLRGA